MTTATTPSQLIIGSVGVPCAAGPKQLVLFSRAGHVFSCRLEPMQPVLADWLKEQLR